MRGRGREGAGRGEGRGRGPDYTEVREAHRLRY